MIRAKFLSVICLTFVLIFGHSYNASAQSWRSHPKGTDVQENKKDKQGKKNKKEGKKKHKRHGNREEKNKKK